MEIVNLLNLSIHNITIAELLEDLNHKGGMVVTPNIDHLVKLQHDQELLKAYYHSSYRVCDSRILQYISSMLGSPIKEKISGSDLFPAFYEYNKNNEDTKIFLLGGEPGVAIKAQKNINSKVDREIVVDALSPSFGFEKDEIECQEIVDRINESGATVLAIGVGAPKQEKWVTKYRNQLTNVKIYLAIGATIDFEAGYKSRSPKWMSEMGLEWFYRLQSEPGRLWKRYLVDSIPFFWLIGQQKLQNYQFNYLDQINCLPLGEILHQAGILSPQQIREALLVQQDNQKYRFGEILVNQGFTNSKTVDFFSEEVHSLLTTEDMKEELRLGDFLSKAGLLNNEQIIQILRQQNNDRQKFGQIVKNNGWVNPQTLNWFVGLQQQKFKIDRQNLHPSRITKTTNILKSGKI